MKRRWVVVMVVLVLLLTAGAVAVWAARGEGEPQAPVFEPAEAVEVLQAREATWQPMADLVGTVFALRTVTVRNELDGMVRYVGFESGAVVEEGQELLRQDDSTERADLDAARAAVRVAQAGVEHADAQIALAEVELRRLTTLGNGAVAEVEVDRARTRLDTARAERVRWLAEADQARAREAQVQARMNKLTIRAPFRARTGLRTVHEGQYLAAGSEVVVLQELSDTIYLDFAVPQEFVPRVKVGTTVMATGVLLGPEPVPITVVAADASVNRDTRNLRVRARVDNRNGVLMPGMAVEVRVPVHEPSRVVVVPSTAVRRAAYGPFVFVVEPGEGDGTMRARQRFVTLGQTIGDEVIVLEGLRDGERIAGAGSFKLRDGVKVMLRPPGEDPGATGGGGYGRGGTP